MRPVRVDFSTWRRRAKKLDFHSRSDAVGVEIGVWGFLCWFECCALTL